MKLMKAMKRLKFWPRLKKRKKYHFLPPSSPPPPSRPPPPPPYYHHLHHHYEPLLPSAPPLPPWLEYDMQFEETPQISSPSPGANISSPHETMDHEHVSHLSEEIQDIIPLCQQDNDLVIGRVEGDEYDVVPELRTLEKRGEFLGAFGCVVGFGEHLVRCVFPCFCIKEKGSEGERAIVHTTNTNV